MGLFDALSAGLNAAAPVAQASTQGAAQAAQSNVGFLEKLAQMQQARNQAEMQRQLQTAQIGDIKAQNELRRQQADALAKKFAPENIQAAADVWEVDKPTAELMMREPATLNYILEKKKAVQRPQVVPAGAGVWNEDKKTWEVPIAAKDTQPKIISTNQGLYRVDANGNATRVTDAQGNPLTAPTKGGGARAGLGQRAEAGLLAAVTEGQAALKRMRAYEDKMLANPSVGPVSKGVDVAKDVLGSYSMLNPAHSPTLQALGSGSLGILDPDLAQYRRDAALVARAEQLMGAGSRSEAAAAGAQLLSRSPSNWDKASVDAARRSREAVLGKFGGIAQTLSPEQADKLNRALSALNAGEANFDYTGAGASLFGGAPSANVTPNAAPRAPQPFSFGGRTYDLSGANKRPIP